MTTVFFTPVSLAAAPLAGTFWVDTFLAGDFLVAWLWVALLWAAAALRLGFLEVIGCGGRLALRPS
ncbi:MAG: hypothetical protein V3T22_02210 [Planctomycetota bacterium]